MTTEKTQVLMITGCLVPYRKGKPLVMDVPGSDNPHLPIFPDEKSLRKAFEGVFDEIRTIEDGENFLTSLPSDYVVVHNPQKRGKCFHWLEIQRNWLKRG